MTDTREARYAEAIGMPAEDAPRSGLLAAVMAVADEELATLTTETPAVIDAAHLANQRAWSEATFGPGIRLGVLDHIRKELKEVEEDPTCLEEWVDVIILGFDGAWRAGHEPQAIIDGIKAKQARNEARSWPDWRTADRDKAIEHVRNLPELQCLIRGSHEAHDWSSLTHRWHCAGVQR